MMRVLTLGTTLAVGLTLLPGQAAAQIGNPLPQALGMGGNYTALARGLGAPAWNPAGLGMPDNPGASFTFLPFGFTAGLGPIGVSDFTDYGGEVIPRDQRVDWLELITANGGEAGTFSTDVTFAALNVGRVALSASNSIRGRVNMAPDVAELFLFGNAGLTGEAGDYSLSGSNFDLAGTTTFAGSLALPLAFSLGPVPDQHFALGATLKYTIGNFLVLGQENGSALNSNPLAVDVEFPMIHTQFPDSTGEYDVFQDILNNGSGLGLDVGAAWTGSIFSAGVVVKNIVDTFEWDTEGLQYRQGTATWSADTSFTSFEARPVADAPPELLNRINELYTFSPVVAAGAAVRVLPFLTVSGEMRHALEDNLDIGIRNHMGVGAELTILPFLPIRAGVSAISGGYQLSGGLGLKLGPVQLSAAGAARQTEFGDDAVGAVGLTFGLR